MRLKFKPHDYQKLAIKHVLENERSALFAGMGMGKTSSTLSAIDALELAGEIKQPTLVIAPLRVANSTWPDEVKKWEHLSHLEVQPITGSVAERKKALLNKNASIFTINYENLPWLIEHLDGNFPFDMVVADESTKLKSFRLRQGSARARALGKVAHSKVKRWINLTGTPSPNGLQDLWGQAWFLDAGQRLGRTYDSFTSRWFQSISFGGHFTQLKPLPFAQEQIEDALRDLCLSLKAEDYFDIDAPIMRTIWVDLPKQSRQMYSEMEKAMFTSIDGDDIEAVSAAAKTIKCLQLANGAAYTDEKGTWKEVHDIKIQALESIIEESGGSPILVAYHFKSDLARLKSAFPKARHLDSDPKTIRDWNAGKIPLLFAHPASAGHGLNLADGGHHLVFFGHWWNLEEYQQIIERIGPTRQTQAGHPRPVFIYHIVARDTVDEMVMARRESKRAIQDILLESLKRRVMQ